jgi:hypothetical protein
VLGTEEVFPLHLGGNLSYIYISLFIEPRLKKIRTVPRVAANARHVNRELQSAKSAHSSIVAH